MTSKINLNKKIAFILLASITLTLFLVGIIFTVLLNSLYTDSAKHDILNSVQIFREELLSKQEQLTKQGRLLQNSEEIIASANLVWKYQDKANYDKLIFDPEKESLAKLLKQVGQNAGFSIVSIYSPTMEPIAFYSKTDHIENSGYASIDNSRNQYIFTDGHKTQLLNPLITDVNFGNKAEHLSYFIKNIRTQQLTIESYSKIIRKLPDSEQLIGWIRLAFLIDQNYVDAAAEKSGSSIAIKNLNQLLSSQNYQPEKIAQKEKMTIPDFTLQKQQDNPPLWRPVNDYFEALYHLPTHQNNTIELYFAIDKSDLHTSIGAFQESIIWVLVISGALVVPLGLLYFRREITQPISGLTQIAGQISFGRFPVFEKPQRNDEIGTLLTAFGRMTEEIQNREASLQTYHHELEKTVSERTAELENSISELNYQKFAMDQHAIVSIANRRGNISYVNQKFCDVSGYSKEELVGQDHNILNSGEHDKSFFAQMWKDICSGKVWHGEIKNRTKNGSYYWVHSTIVPFLDKHGAPYQFVSIRTDITRQKDTENQLQFAKVEADKANKAKSEFLSNMSHELRTPLNSILGFAQLLEHSKNNPLDERQLDQIKYILNGGEHLLGLIDDVLELAKIEAGKLTLSVEQVEFSYLLNDCVNLAHPLTSKYKVTISNRCEQMPSVYVDYLRAKQVILNLLSNAIKYNKPQGQVWIDSSIEQHYLKLTICDTGPGIPKERQHELFKPFNRLGADQSNIEGTGIGLSLSKKLIEEMHGSIGIESETEQGSMFWVRFPLLSKANTEQIEATKAENIEANFELKLSNPKKLLYIEDNPANMQLMEDLVADINNLDMLLAPNAELGIELASDSHPDLIIMDINLPGMDGFSAAQILKESPETVHIPLIALSASATNSMIDKGLQAGFYDYLTKPVNVKKLLFLMKNILTPDD